MSFSSIMESYIRHRGRVMALDEEVQTRFGVNYDIRCLSGESFQTMSRNQIFCNVKNELSHLCPQVAAQQLFHNTESTYQQSPPPPPLLGERSPRLMRISDPLCCLLIVMVARNDKTYFDLTSIEVNYISTNQITPKINMGTIDHSSGINPDDPILHLLQ